MIVMRYDLPIHCYGDSPAGQLELAQQFGKTLLTAKLVVVSVQFDCNHAFPIWTHS